jgi:alpha-aminoadipic semialdehyde synthase
MKPSSTFKIGIRKEEFNKWERRCALTPKEALWLLQKMGSNLEIKVQSSDLRVFKDSEWEAVGCTISKDISDCDLIIGVKQIPDDQLFENKTYMFFAHVIKAQQENMHMLDVILKKNIRLIDYEKICDEKGRRLVAFGKFAGYAGAIGNASLFSFNLLIQSKLNFRYSIRDREIFVESGNWVDPTEH